MGGVYKHVLPDGSVTFTDSPQGPGTFQQIKPGEIPKSERERDWEAAQKAVKKAPTIIPTVEQYLAYLDYLRHHSPARLDRVLRELKVTDPKTWLKLQKYPQFKPLHDTVTGLKAGEKHLTAVVGIAGGDFSGAGKKWLETSLKDLMKRDRFGPFSEVLTEKSAAAASKARPALAADLAYNAKAGAAAAKDLRASTAALRSGGATAVSRVGGGFLDVFIQFLNPERGQDAAVIALAIRRRKLESKGIIDVEEAEEIQNLIAQGQYAQATERMDQAVHRYLYPK